MRPSDTKAHTVAAIIANAHAALARRSPRARIERQAAVLVYEALQRLEMWTRDTRETSRREAYGSARAALALCDFVDGAGRSGATEALDNLARAVMAATETRNVDALTLAHKAASVRAA